MKRLQNCKFPYHKSRWILEGHPSQPALCHNLILLTILGSSCASNTVNEAAAVAATKLDLSYLVLFIDGEKIIQYSNQVLEGHIQKGPNE